MELVAIFVVIVIFAIGGYGTFKRNWFLSLVLLVLLFPVWAIWAFVEMILTFFGLDAEDPNLKKKNCCCKGC